MEWITIWMQNGVEFAKNLFTVILLYYLIRFIITLRNYIHSKPSGD